MKKYFYLLIYVLVHIITVVMFLHISVSVFNYVVIRDTKKITMFIFVICSLEWLLFGYLYNMKLKYKIKEIVISIIIISLILFIINQLDWSILTVRLSMIHILSFTGLFLTSVIKGNLLGEFGLPAYIVYYVLLFILGIFIKKRIYLLKKSKKEDKPLLH